MVPLRKFNLTERNPRKPLVNLFQVEPELLKRLEKAELTLKKITSEPDCLVELGRNEDSLTEIVSEGYRSKYSSIEEE